MAWLAMVKMKPALLTVAGGKGKNTGGKRNENFKDNATADSGYKSGRGYIPSRPGGSRTEWGSGGSSNGQCYALGWTSSLGQETANGQCYALGWTFSLGQETTEDAGGQSNRY